MEDAPPRKRPRGNAATTPAHSAPIPSTSQPSASARAPYTPAPRHQLATLQVKLPPAYLPPQASATAFQLPTPLTSFSYSPARELLTGERRDEAMAEYWEPELGADLNRGFEHCSWRDGTVDEGLDGLLDACVVDWLCRTQADGIGTVDWNRGQISTKLGRRTNCFRKRMSLRGEE